MNDSTHGARAGCGRYTLPLSTCGLTACARATLPPSGVTGTSPGIWWRSAWITAGPLALSSTSFRLAFGHFTVMALSHGFRESQALAFQVEQVAVGGFDAPHTTGHIIRRRQILESQIPGLKLLVKFIGQVHCMDPEDCAIRLAHEYRRAIDGLVLPEAPPRLLENAAARG